MMKLPRTRAEEHPAPRQLPVPLGRIIGWPTQEDVEQYISTMKIWPFEEMAKMRFAKMTDERVTTMSVNFGFLLY